MKRLALIAALALVGCAQPGPKPLYQWDGYQAAVYQYLKSNGSEPGAQIPLLEAQVEKNQAKGVATPEAERAQFPESAAYVDFLLKTATKDAGKSVGNAPAAAASQPRT